MAAAEYFIERDGAGWKIRLGDLYYSPYQTLGEAFAAAVDAAHAAGKSGLVAKVLLQRTNGTWQVVWRYQRDPYPPRLGSK